MNDITKHSSIAILSGKPWPLIVRGTWKLAKDHNNILLNTSMATQRQITDKYAKKLSEIMKIGGKYSPKRVIL